MALISRLGRSASGIPHMRMTALERRYGRFMRSEDGHEGGGPPTPSPTPAPTPTPTPSPTPTPAPTGDQGSWFAGLSDDAPDQASPSDLAWMRNKGFADLPAFVRSSRELEKRLGAKPAGIEVPGEGATPEQVTAYHRAIGVPEAADGYTFDVPEGWEGDMAIIGGLREKALAGGTPLAAWTAMTDGFKQVVMDRHNQLVTAQNAELTEWKSAQGAQADQNATLAQRGFEAMGMNPDEIQAIQTSLGEGGTKRMMDLGLKMGRLSGEDSFISGGTRDTGYTLATARTALAAFEKDDAKVKKLFAGDAAAKAEHQRLTTVIAQFEEAERRRLAAA